MDTALLEALLAAPDDEALRMLIETHALDGDTVAALKAQSGRFYFDRPAEALRIAEAAHRLGRSLPDPACALGQWTLGSALLFVDRYREAADLLDEARARYLAQGLPLDAARVGMSLVWALAYTGQFDRALAVARESEPLLVTAAEDSPEDHRRLGGLFNNLGIVHDLLGQYEEALAAYDRKLAIARALGNELDAARTHHNRAYALTFLNAFDEALAAFEQAETGFAAAGAEPDLARLAFSRGTLYARWGRYAEAEASFAEADRRLAALAGVEQHRLVVSLYRGLARLQSEAPVDAALRQAFDEARAAFAVHGPPFEEGLAWLGLGRCHLALGDLDAAQGAFERALALAEAGAGRPLAGLAWHGLGNLAEVRGETATATEAYQAALQHVETIRRDLHVEAFRAGFLADKMVVYQDLILLHLRLGQLPEAFATVERAKSRVLAERLEQRLRESADDLAASEDPAERALAVRLRAVLDDLDELYRVARVDHGAEERGSDWVPDLSPAVLAGVEQLEAEARALSRELERRRPGFAPLASDAAVSLADLPSALGGAVLLQYYRARGRVGAFVVDAGGLRAHCQLAGLADVERASRRFAAAVERALGLATRYGLGTVVRYLPSLQADADGQLAALYDLLWRPLAGHVPSGGPVIVAPDGVLHYVPFHALYDGQRYLIERRAVSYTPSATVLEMGRRRAVTGRGTLVVGHSRGRIPQVTAEVTALADLFPDADCLLGREATTDQVLARAPRCRLLHLATHAHFRADEVMLSSLALADRNLTLAEVARLNLAAELVTLSGCETGRGRLRGADLISLARGFMGAGAASLLVSLWRVDDQATARLMTAFYRALRDGATRAGALRMAQCQMLALGRQQVGEFGIYRHPAYWAPFVLIGQVNEIER